MVEFAISFGFIFPLLYGTFQFGLSFLNYNELVNAVRAGARYASYRTYDSATSTPSAAFRDAVRNVVVYGNPGGGTTPTFAGIRPSNVDVRATFENNVPVAVTVAISGFDMNVAMADVRLNKPEVTFPYTGRFAP